MEFMSVSKDNSKNLKYLRKTLCQYARITGSLVKTLPWLTSPGVHAGTLQDRRLAQLCSLQAALAPCPQAGPGFFL